MTSYRLSIVTFPLSLRVSARHIGYCRFCAPARHFSHLTSSLPKISPRSLGVGAWLLATKSEGVGLIVRAVSLQDFQPRRMWSWSTNVDHRRTDRRTTCNLNTALCIVHRAVKTAMAKNETMIGQKIVWIKSEKVVSKTNKMLSCLYWEFSVYLDAIFLRRDAVPMSKIETKWATYAVSLNIQHITTRIHIFKTIKCNWDKATVKDQQ